MQPETPNAGKACPHVWVFDAKRKWQPLKRDKSTSRYFVARVAASRPKKFAPLAKKLMRSTCSKSTKQIRMVLLIASEMSSRIICSSSVSSKGKVGNESFPCTHNLGERSGQVWQDNSRPLLTHEKKWNRSCCSPIGHNNTKPFLGLIRSQHALDCLEMVWWKSVPRGSSARAWKLFSRLTWLPPRSPRMQTRSLVA